VPTPLDLVSRKVRSPKRAHLAWWQVFGLQGLGATSSVWKTSASRNGFFIKTCPGPRNGICVERGPDETKVRPSLRWVARSSRKSVLSGKNYAGWSTSGLRGGLDFTKDDENINSQPVSSGWQNAVSSSLLKAVRIGPNRKPARKGHYSMHRRHPEEMYRVAAEFAQRTRYRHHTMHTHHRRLHCQCWDKQLYETTSSNRTHTLGSKPTAPTGLSKRVAARTACCCTFTLPCARCPSPQASASTFAVLANVPAPSPWCDQLHTGPWWQALKADRQTSPGSLTSCVNPSCPEAGSRGNVFDKDWVRCARPSSPWPRGGIPRPWTCGPGGDFPATIPAPVLWMYSHGPLSLFRRWAARRQPGALGKPAFQGPHAGRRDRKGKAPRQS